MESLFNQPSYFAECGVDSIVSIIGERQEENLAISQKRQKDAKNGATQPFLAKFASVALALSLPKPPPGTTYTHVARETTDDR